jgi:hypothetical protein
MDKKRLLLSLAVISALSTFTGCSTVEETETTTTSSSTQTDTSNTEDTSGTTEDAQTSDTTDTTDTTDTSSNTNTTSDTGTSSTTDSQMTYETHALSTDAQWDNSGASAIVLNGDSISTDESTIKINDTTLTITQGGVYHISGSLDDGNIIVDADDDQVVKLILDNVEISSSTTAPIFVLNAQKTIIISPDESQNSLIDASDYVYESSDEDEPSAAIFSKDDLSIYGNGLLTITANYNDAIKSKDGLVLNANITINSVDDGIIGKDYIHILGGTYTLYTEGDGFKSSNDEDAQKGYILVEYASINVTSANDAIQAETNIKIEDGIFDLTCGGGSGIVLSDDDSAKGIKAAADIIINSGVYVINSADDSIHANSDITINDGTYTINTGDDGVHADESLTINGGVIYVNESYEGIESALMTISGGEMYLTSSDDGLNVAGGSNSTTSTTFGGRPSHDQFSSSGNYYLYMLGGKVVINAQGDGVDVNGNVEMSGGTILVNGPTSSGNGALDYDGTFNISGGLLVATGSSGMAQAPSSSSSQYSVMINFNSTLSADTMVHLESADGENILSFVPSKAYQSLIFSSPNLSLGTNYSLYYGGSDSGEENDGLYTSGNYNSGTLYTTFTISSTVTSNSSSRR